MFAFFCFLLCDKHVLSRGRKREDPGNEVAILDDGIVVS